jgi:elongator complex protein 3
LKKGWKVGVPRLSRLDYQASGSSEIFLSFEDERQTLFGLLRLRIEPEPIVSLGSRSPLAIVRELHVFGSEVSLGKRGENTLQHRGLGKTLLAEAERIAATEFGTELIAVLSGVGARQYYADLGYSYSSGYMTKNLESVT